MNLDGIFKYFQSTAAQLWLQLSALLCFNTQHHSEWLTVYLNERDDRRLLTGMQRSGEDCPGSLRGVLATLGVTSGVSTLSDGSPAPSRFGAWLQQGALTSVTNYAPILGLGIAFFLSCLMMK